MYFDVRRCDVVGVVLQYLLRYDTEVWCDIIIVHVVIEMWYGILNYSDYNVTMCMYFYFVIASYAFYLYSCFAMLQQ